MGFSGVFLCCALIFVANVGIMIARPKEGEEVSYDQILLPSHEFLPHSFLLFFRILALGTITFTNIAILFRKPLVVTGTTRFQETRMMKLSGLSRFTTFTVWSWVVQGIYFFSVVSCSVLQSNPTTSQHWVLPGLRFWSWVLFEISLAVSILVSLVVTYVLYPFAVKAKVDFSLFFEWPSLAMHNLNLVFMAVELLINSFPSVNPWHAPYGIFYGLTYVAFAWLWEFNGGVFYYFFLNYSHKRAIIFHIGLVLALYIFFFIGWLLKTELVLYPAAAPIAIVFGLSQALMFRPYKVQSAK
jgi:hypothetical protein